MLAEMFSAVTLHILLVTLSLNGFIQNVSSDGVLELLQMCDFATVTLP